MDKRNGQKSITVDDKAQNIAKWQWQQPGHTWRGIGIYHITIIIPSRQPILGTLQIPNNDPQLAFVEKTEIGTRIINCLRNVPDFHPELRILSYSLMPDHLHAVVYVTRPMPTGIRMVVRGIWQGMRKIEPQFTQMPHIRVMSRSGQLNTMIQYVKLNPQRLATKRIMPGYFHVMHHVDIDGHTFDAIGNIGILQIEKREVVHVHRELVFEAERHNNPQPLRDYMNSCILTARNDAVMVSPFISRYEKAVMRQLIKEEKPIIYLTDNGFGDYYKPAGELFDACADGRVLILSPWQQDKEKKKISRCDCIQLNDMADALCNKGEKTYEAGNGCGQ